MIAPLAIRDLLRMIQTNAYAWMNRPSSVMVMSSPTRNATGKAVFQVKLQSLRLIRDRLTHFDQQRAR